MAKWRFGHNGTAGKSAGICIQIANHDLLVLGKGPTSISFDNFIAAEITEGQAGKRYARLVKFLITG